MSADLPLNRFELEWIGPYQIEMLDDRIANGCYVVRIADSCAPANRSETSFKDYEIAKAVFTALIAQAMMRELETIAKP